MIEDWVSVGYLISAILFIMGLKKLGHPRTAPRGNQLGALGMLVAVLTTIADMQFAGDIYWVLIGSGILLGSAIGYWMAVKVEMTGMPRHAQPSTRCKPSGIGLLAVAKGDTKNTSPEFMIVRPASAMFAISPSRVSTVLCAPHAHAWWWVGVQSE